MSGPVTGLTKLALGVIVPVFAFLVFEFFLLRSVGGKGEDLGFAGTVLFFRSFIIVPLVFIANALLMRRDWKSKSAVLVVGFALPAAAAVYEFVSLYGHQ